MWIWLLGVALFSLLVAVAAFMQIKRSTREAQESEQRLNQRIEVLENELSAMMDGAFGVASQLQKVESNLKSTVQQQEQLHQRDMGNLPYNEAVRRASKGADVGELVEHCGLSRSEAELVEMLHKKSSPPVIDEPDAAVPDVKSGPVAGGEAEQQNDWLQDEQLEPEAASKERVKTEYLQPDDDDDPLFSGDLEGDNFQQALERAREFQTQPSPPSSDAPLASNDPVEQSKESDERH